MLIVLAYVSHFKAYFPPSLEKLWFCWAVLLLESWCKLILEFLGKLLCSWTQGSGPAPYVTDEGMEAREGVWFACDHESRPRPSLKVDSGSSECPKCRVCNCIISSDTSAFLCLFVNPYLRIFPLIFKESRREGGEEGGERGKKQEHQHDRETSIGGLVHVSQLGPRIQRPT